LVRVLVIAEVRLYRDGLAAALAHDSRLAVIGASETASRALRLLAAQPPDVIVVDPGRDPIDALRLLARHAPAARVLVVAVRDDMADVVALAEEGAAGFVTRDESIEDFVACVVSVAGGDTLCSPQIAGALVRRVAALARAAPPAEPLPRLTGREREVAQLLDQGLSNKQIAGALCIELATVKNHVHNVLDKLDVRRRSQVPARLRATASRSRV
jgi:DNA-binding NarL/FixJ family response regulator